MKKMHHFLESEDIGTVLFCPPSPTAPMLITFARSDIYDDNPSPTREIYICSLCITLHSPNPTTRASLSNAGIFLFAHKHSYSYSRY